MLKLFCKNNISQQVVRNCIDGQFCKNASVCDTPISDVHFRVLLKFGEGVFYSNDRFSIISFGVFNFRYERMYRLANAIFFYNTPISMISFICLIDLRISKLTTNSFCAASSGVNRLHKREIKLLCIL